MAIVIILAIKTVVTIVTFVAVTTVIAIVTVVALVNIVAIKTVFSFPKLNRISNAKNSFQGNFSNLSCRRGGCQECH